MKGFFRVQKKDDNEDFNDFKTEEEARSFISENNISDETHILFRLKKKNSAEVKLSFDPQGRALYVTNPNAPEQLFMIGAIATKRASGANS